MRNILCILAFFTLLFCGIMRLHAQSNWNQLIVRDSMGQSQTLYFGPPDTIDLHQYELPPPTAGVFDVRFDSNRSVFLGDSLSSKWTIIHISNAVDPITISWRIIDSSIVNSYLFFFSDSTQKQMHGLDSVKKRLRGMLTYLSMVPKPIILPTEFRLGPADPNPFDSSGTGITYQVPSNCFLQLWIENIAGTFQKTLDSGQHNAGVYHVLWNARDRDSVLVPFGIYVCKLWATAGATTLFRDSLYLYFHTPSFSIPFVSDAHGVISFGLNFGVHPKATKGIDAALGEQEYPPFPLGDGITMFTSVFGNSILDLRPYTSPSQADTYKVGFTVDGGTYPITFTWPDINPFYSGSVRLKGYLNDSSLNLDMKAYNSYTVVSGQEFGTVYFSIIAQGPLPVDSMPVISTYGVGNNGFQAIVNASNGTMLKKTHLTAGSTEVWFEYGPTQSYGTATVHQYVPAGTSLNISEPFDTASLPMDTRIYFRAVAQNGLGTFYGGDRIVSHGNPQPESVDLMIEGVPKIIQLDQNYPNPFNPSTTINYQLPTQSHVTLKVFDMLGREVATLVNGVEQPGFKLVTFDASRLASGVYYYRMQAGKYIETKKLLLLR
jgi:hypothetical protein